MVENGKGFQIFAHILLSFLIICAIAPFILLIMSSFTEEQTLITNGYSFFLQNSAPMPMSICLRNPPQWSAAMAFLFW